MLLDGKGLPFEISLFAPNNHKAMIAGTFSDWKDLPMAKGKDGFFRISLRLPDGEYRYVFRIQSKSWFFAPNEWVTVIDPYATDVDTKTSGAVLRIRDGISVVDTYRWKHDSVPLPENSELIIYELHIGDFSGGEGGNLRRGTFDALTDKLGYLLDLGINAIELMPFKEFPGSHGWGYNPCYFMAAETTYGPTDRLKRLIDECHGLGFRVIMDDVYNHASPETPLAQIDHDYWFHHHPKDREMSWGPEFNYDYYDSRLNVRPARAFIGDVARFWIREYHVDGIRYDAVKQIDNFDFLEWIVNETRVAAKGKPFFNVAELIPLNPSVCAPEGPMDGCWHESFLHVVTEAITGEVDLERLMSVIDPRRGGFKLGTSVVNYLGTHDHERVLSKLESRGFSGADAFKRIRLGFVMLLTAMGIPMIWMGDEFGVNTARTLDSNKIDWQLLAGDENRRLQLFLRDLIRFRKSSPVLRSDEIRFAQVDPHNQVLAYHRPDENGGGVMVILNFSCQDLHEYRVPGFHQDGQWHIWNTQDRHTVCGGEATLSLPALEACLLISPTGHP